MFREMKDVYMDIPKYRMQKNMTCKELADIIGVSEDCLKNAEEGNGELGLLTFIKLCKVLDLDPDEILTK